ncbi:hypothetical protein KIPE111705_06300 [Kibdelosporangium persicum]|nr:hypothetical protein [Kibdelosporangium persicum]
MHLRVVGRPPDLSPEKLAPQARACLALADARTLAEWVGDGREVTTRGVLKPAAAVEACDLLGIEPPSRKPRSALDIDALMMVWMAACAAGFIEVSRSRVTTGPTLRLWQEGTPDIVLTIWSKCVLESIGLAGETNEDGLEYLAVLATLDGHGGVASLRDLTAAIAQVNGGASACACPECASRAPDADESDAQDVVLDLGEFGIAVLADDVVELMPLGHWLTDFMFRESAPSAQVDAAGLIDELSQFPEMVAVLMARPWLSARTPAAAVRDLLAVAESLTGRERLIALTVAQEGGPEAAPAWREWAARDGFGAYARIWLAKQDGAEPAAADSAWTAADALAMLVDTLRRDVALEFVPALLQAEAGTDLARTVAELRTCGHPSAPRLVKLLSGASGGEVAF